MILSAEPESRHFRFERDTFAFANELVWQYRLDPASGRMETFRNVPAPTYALRCFVLVRSARQFLYHARFDPSLPKADEAAYRRLIRAVVARSPRQPCRDEERVVIPGHASLRTFSQAEEKLLKAECGAAWQSYVLRSHWRMVFPISRRHQARTAEQLVKALDDRPAPIVHLVRFPQLTINHGIILFDVERTSEGFRFAAYDPNVPQQPSELNYHEAERTFCFPRNQYWAGGKLNVIEIYRGWFY